MKKLTFDTFISRAEAIHNKKYDYSKVVFALAATPIIIGCPIHGNFKMLRGNHLKGQGCPTCGRIKNTHSIRHTLEKFIKRSEEIHGVGRYDYSNTEYVTYTSCKKVELKCNVCDFVFEVLPTNHIHKQSGCPCCNWKGGIDDGYFIENPQMKNKDAIIYTIRIYSVNESFYKIGITTQGLGKRFKQLHKCGYEYEVISTTDTTLYNAYLTEQEFLKNRKVPYYPKIKFDGWTECFILPIE